MNKKGFTLAETLITLGIIGVSAALIAPSLKHLMPDSNKIEFMECYKQLTTTLPEIVSNERFYFVKWECTAADCSGGNFVYIKPTCHGLGCLDADAEYGCSNRAKLACLLDNVIDSNKYEWSGSTTTGYSWNDVYNVNVDTAIAHTLHCTAKRSGKKYTFNLKGNGTIKSVSGDAKSEYLEDMFNYYKKKKED